MCITCFPYQLEGKAEQSALLVAMEALRAPFESKWTEEGTQRLVLVGEGIAALLEQGTPIAAINEEVGKQRSLIEDFYSDLFTDTIPHFASQSFGALKSYLPPLRKDEGDVWRAAIEAFLGEHLSRLGRLATDTVRKLVVAVLEDGLEEGLGVDAIARKLRKEWPDLAQFEAERIVRTEIIPASNYGSMAGARATGLPLEKEWIKTNDGRTRESHDKAGGQRVGLDALFTVGGYSAMYPGDPNLPAAERIQCRCTQGYHVIGRS